MEKINAVIYPETRMNVLSHIEVNKLLTSSKNGMYELFRKCSLAVLNSGHNIDDGKVLLEQFHDFEIELIQKDKGVELKLINAPAQAFVDGIIIQGIKEHLFSVLRDLVYVNNEINLKEYKDSNLITNGVFCTLRNANIFHRSLNKLAVCWGGHSISRTEYEYSKVVGYELGLRGFNICTGCGIGAMKGPMKGAAVAHAKQRINNGFYLGVSEPGIIASEPPNAIVNELVLLSDIEKRLEAFVRLGHGIVIFPGGVGTAEEILYIIGILTDPANSEIPFPIVLTGPKNTDNYFKEIIQFIKQIFGQDVVDKFDVVINDPKEVAVKLLDGVNKVYDYRKKRNDADYFNWRLKINKEFQSPFDPSHENMAALNLGRDQKLHNLAANLRRAMSGIVAGNVKELGIKSVEENGPFMIKGDKEIMHSLDILLSMFAKQKRMKLDNDYIPCYKLIK